MRIAVDAMGGDHAPGVVVEGAVQAARDLGIEIVLVGQRPAMEAELEKHDWAGLRLTLRHASEVIAMDEHDPALAARAKKDSSMIVGTELVKHHEADGFYTAGQTGGALAAALLRLGRIRGIRRPGLGTRLPSQTPQGHCFLLDIGATPDCKPEYLLQFAIMGVTYSERVLGISNPRVALVSNGEEEGKGNELIKQATPLLKDSGLNFIGNAEGKDIPRGIADVVVTDGFTGNVIIKLAEGLSKFLQTMIKEQIMSRPLWMVGGKLAEPAFDEIKRRLDYREYGGAQLLGVDGVVMVGHGRSDAWAVRNGIRMTAQTVENGVLEAIKRGLERYQR